MKNQQKNTNQIFSKGLQNIEWILEKVNDKKVYEKAIRQANKKYEIVTFKVMSMTPFKARKIYPALIEKYHQNFGLQTAWLQNQRKLFLWLVLCYLFIKQKIISDLSFQDFTYFSEIFNHKDQNFLMYQIHALTNKQRKHQKWTTQEDQLLIKIIKEEKNQKVQKQWNQISRKLFQQSGHKLYRSGKQCRQKWMNHLDPNTIKGAWTTQQDYFIFTQVKEKGKKWSQIAKDLDGCRTQHMVKNRFNSLIHKKGKLLKSRNQEKILNLLIQQLEDDFPKNPPFTNQYKTISFGGSQERLEFIEQKRQLRLDESSKIEQVQKSINADKIKKLQTFERNNSFSLSEFEGFIPQFANSLFEQAHSQNELAYFKLSNSNQLSQKSGKPFFLGSPSVGNFTPNFYFQQEHNWKQKINNFVNMDQSLRASSSYQLKSRDSSSYQINFRTSTSYQFSQSCSSNFDKFIPNKQKQEKK